MLNFLKQFTGTAIVCEKCGSKYVGFSDVNTSKTPFGKAEIMYKVKCRECDATGSVIEIWEQEDSMKLISIEERKGLICTLCKTNLSVKYLHDDGKVYCNACILKVQK